MNIREQVSEKKLLQLNNRLARKWVDPKYNTGHCPPYFLKIYRSSSGKKLYLSAR